MKVILDFFLFLLSGQISAINEEQINVKDGQGGPLHFMV